VPESRKLNVVG